MGVYLETRQTLTVRSEQYPASIRTRLVAIVPVYQIIRKTDGWKCNG